MKKMRNKKMLGLAAAALVLTAGAATGKAMAYFTTYVTAQGGHELELGFTTTIPNEVVKDWTKDITLTNTGEKDCYVRVKTFAGTKYKLDYVDGSGGSWSAGPEGYYYWHGILAPGETTGSLLVKIDKLEATESFNVIVVQECTPVPYDEEGNALSWDQVDWSRIADVVKNESQETVKGEEGKV